MGNKKPNKDEIEITVAGPGFGESIIVHLGSDQWMIIDSCRINRSQKPFPLEYLKSIGVDFSSVCLIVATHWHDDHIKGLCETVKNCPNAKFACAGILLENELGTLLDLQNDDPDFTSDSSEFDGIISHFKTEGKLEDKNNYPLIFASTNKPIWSRISNSKDEPSCKVVSLSPSEMATTKWLSSFADNLKPNQKFRKRIAAPNPNQISVALWLKIGEVAILLGADLEEENNPVGGWKVIVNSNERPQEKACLNKVAHHGSKNGHHDEVWTNMLEKNPVAVLTPYSRGKKLPTQADAERIMRLTNQAYITSDLKNRSIRGSTGSVDRTINEIANKIRVIDAEDGYIRMRKSALDLEAKWKIDRFGRALELKSLYPQDGA